MLSFFRNFTKSRYGLIAVFFVLGIIALAFAAGDVTGLRSVGLAGGGHVLARVGDKTITDADMRDQLDLIQRGARQQGQAFDMDQFLAQGGYESVLQELISNAQVIEFARQNGMAVGKGTIDAKITAIPRFQGADGKFDQKAFDQFLIEERFSAKRVRDDIADATYRNWLIQPLTSLPTPPAQLTDLYTAMELQRRKGTVALIRWADVAKPAEPDDKTLQTYYTANRGRYLIPERRVIRYAVVKIDDIKASSAATDAEIAEAYKKSGSRFAATEKRSVRQLVVTDQASAEKVAAEVKGGKSLADAAKELKLEAASFDSLEKADLARQTSDTVANAAFGANQGDVLGPMRTSLGWAVLRVEKVEKIAAKSLEEARPILAEEVTLRKTVAALAAKRQEIEDEIGGGSTFDEAVNRAKLTVDRIGPVNANGTSPDDPKAKPDPDLANVVQAGFQMAQGDDPQIVAFGKQGSFAMVAPERIIAAAPRPLAEIRKQVHDEYLVDEALKAARAAAAQVVKKLDSGVPMAKALAEAGIAHPLLRPFDLKREEMKRDAPEGELLAFKTAAGKAAQAQDSKRVGVWVVQVDAVEKGDPKSNDTARGEIERQLGEALAQEQLGALGEAIRRAVPAKRNESAIAAVKASLSSSGAR